MEKVKVSPDLAEAIERNIERFGKNEFLKYQSNHYWNFKENESLNHITTFELAEILVRGYEIEQTTEEKLSSTYWQYRTIAEAGETEQIKSDAVQFVRGIECAVSTLNLKIKGINS